MKECYSSIGIKKLSPEDTQRPGRWMKEKELVRELLKPNGIFLQCGWNSWGMGKKHGYRLEELLLVCFGQGHYDTICIAERKLAEQGRLF